MGLHGFENRDLQSLSGGEYQRMLIAMVMVQQPSIYLLDEPVNHLDWQHQHQVLEILTSLAADKNNSLIMALHDVNLAARYCSHCLMIFDNGRIESGETTSLLNTDNLKNLYHTPIVYIESHSGKLFTPA